MTFLDIFNSNDFLDIFQLPFLDIFKSDDLSLYILLHKNDFTTAQISFRTALFV